MTLQIEREYEQFLSAREKKIFDALASSVSMKEAAAKLGVAAQTLYNWKHDVMKRRRRYIGWLKATSAQRKRSRLLQKLMTQRIAISAEQELLEIAKIDREERDPSTSTGEEE